MLKKIFLNLSLIVGACYFPLFFYSLFIHLTPSEYEKIAQKKIIEEDIPLKKKAVKSGYNSVFYPNNTVEKIEKLKIYPIGALPFTKYFLCNEGYGLIKYKSDRFGLRNSDEVWAKIKGESNIFVVGDSFVHGACVPDNNLITNYIQKGTKLNTILLGKGGNTPYEYMAKMKSVVEPILKKSTKRNYVILIFYFNDNVEKNFNKENLLRNTESIVNYSQEKGFYPKIKYKKNIAEFMKKVNPNTPEQMFSKYEEWEFKMSSYYQVLTLVPVRDILNKALGLLLTKKEENKLSNKYYIYSPSEESIFLLSNICNTSCKPLVVYIPYSTKWNPKVEKGNFYEKELKNISEKMGIEFLNGEDVIDSSNDNDFAPKGAHLSKKGYKKISDLILKNLKQ